MAAHLDKTCSRPGTFFSQAVPIKIAVMISKSLGHVQVVSFIGPNNKHGMKIVDSNTGLTFIESGPLFHDKEVAIEYGNSILDAAIDMLTWPNSNCSSYNCMKDQL